MKPRNFLFLILGLALIFLASRSYSEEPTYDSWGLGIPLHDKMKHLCGGNVLGQHGEEIIWEDYTSKLSPAQLLADYQKKLGMEHFEAKGQGGIWRFPRKRAGMVMSAPDVMEILDITPIADYQPHGCPKKPPAKALTVVEMSAMYQRGQK